MRDRPPGRAETGLRRQKVSVAFRRESDEEHKEPRFELPIPPGPNLVTAAGLTLVESRVAELEALVATEPDEPTLADAQRSLRYWRTRLATAELAPPPPEDEAGFGSRVTFRLNGAERTVEIVGDDEADPAAGKIAFSAPLARALIGAGTGDFSDFGGKADAIEIVAIGPIES
jgi:hypothetical protein